MGSSASGGVASVYLRRLLSWVAVFLGMSLSAGAVLADPPGRVGRLAELEGQVWLFDAQSNEWVSALLNRPITSGDRISTDAQSRGVLRIGPTSVMVDGLTELEVTRLDDETVTLQLHSGSLGLRLRSRETALEYLVQTREGSFKPQRAGHYRIDRRDDVSTASVLSGQLGYSAGRYGANLNEGQRAEFFGSGPVQQGMLEPERDAFAQWMTAKLSREERSVSSRYVSPEMTGAEELDRYGRWEQAPDYGAIWIPLSVRDGWAPYSQGRWVSIAPWGWTWVDDAPWGFAPFHYGRWAKYRGRWVWVPGSYVQRPVYAPALVAWIGGSHISLSISIGSRMPPTVGWFPLGPRDIYAPHYRASRDYWRHVNRHHMHDDEAIDRARERRDRPHERYSNREERDAVTVVPINSLGRGRSIERIKDPEMIREVVRGPVRSEPGVNLPVIDTDSPRRPDRTRPIPVANQGWDRDESTRSTGTIPQGWDRDDSGRAPGRTQPGARDDGDSRRAPQTQAPAPQIAAPGMAEPVRPRESLTRPGQADSMSREPRHEAPPMGRRDPAPAFEPPAQRERLMPPPAMQQREAPQPMPAMRVPAPVQIQAPTPQGADSARDAGMRPPTPDRRRMDRDEAPRKADERRVEKREEKREDKREDRRDNKGRANLE